MTPVIRLSDATFERLKKWATPLVDTADTTLNKVLDAAEKVSASREHETLAPTSAEADPSIGHDRDVETHMTPRTAYREPIIVTVAELGSKARKDDVEEAFFQKMRAQLSDADLRPLPADWVARWKKNVEWMRWSLKEEGVFKRDSPRGVWELSEEGLREANSIANRSRDAQH